MSARSIFAVFFQTKIKSVARAQKDARFYSFYLIVAQLVLRTDAISYSPIFIYKRLYMFVLAGYLNVVFISIGISISITNY